jgi:hypothetical protein
MNEPPHGTETVPTTPLPPQTYEQNDLSFRPIILFGVGLIGITLLVLLSMSVFFTSLAARRAQQDPPLSPLAQARPQHPPEPRLQIAPRLDLQHLRQAEDDILHSYGWVDRGAGIVRIPIEQAMDLLAARGLPARPAPQGGENKP